MTTTIPGKEDGAVQENDGKTLWNKQAFSLHNKNSYTFKILKHVFFFLLQVSISAFALLKILNETVSKEIIFLMNIVLKRSFSYLLYCFLLICSLKNIKT